MMLFGPTRLLIFPTGEKILEKFQAHYFLRDLKFPPFSPLLRNRGKGAGFSNLVKNRVLESCSNVFFPLELSHIFSMLLKIQLEFHESNGNRRKKAF